MEQSKHRHATPLRAQCEKERSELYRLLEMMVSAAQDPCNEKRTARSNSVIGCMFSLTGQAGLEYE
ncbi:hypothetical protein WBG83_10035 [Paenibacillus sp. y28]